MYGGNAKWGDDGDIGVGERDTRGLVEVVTASRVGVIGIGIDERRLGDVVFGTGTISAVSMTASVVSASMAAS